MSSPPRNLLLEALDELPEDLHGRCTTEPVASALAVLFREICRDDLDKAAWLVEAIDDLVKARLEEQQAAPNVVLEGRMDFLQQQIDELERRR